MGRGDWLATLLAAACFYHFGREVERYLGIIKFAGIVVTAALAAAALGFAASPPDVGAAGAAAAGVLVAYMRLWPVNRVSMFGSVAFSARDFLVAFIGLSVLGSLGGGQRRWEGLVPLAGLAATVLFLVVVDRDSARAKFHARRHTALYGDGRSATEIDWSAVPRAGLHELTLMELERVEAKANVDGMRSLTGRGARVRPSPAASRFTRARERRVARPRPPLRLDWRRWSTPTGRTPRGERAGSSRPASRAGRSSRSRR